MSETCSGCEICHGTLRLAGTRASPHQGIGPGHPLFARLERLCAHAIRRDGRDYSGGTVLDALTVARLQLERAGAARQR
jgi:hypothetical protein